MPLDSLEAVRFDPSNHNLGLLMRDVEQRKYSLGAAREAVRKGLAFWISVYRRQEEQADALEETYLAVKANALEETYLAVAALEKGEEVNYRGVRIPALKPE